MKCVDTTRISMFDPTDVEVFVWGFSRSLECLLHNSWWSCWSSKSEGDACFGSCQAAKMCCNMSHGRLWLLDRAIHSLPMWLLLCSLGSIRHPGLLRQAVKMSHTFESNFIFFEASEHSVDVFKKHMSMLSVNRSYFNIFRILMTFRL